MGGGDARVAFDNWQREGRDSINLIIVLLKITAISAISAIYFS